MFCVSVVVSLVLLVIVMLFFFMWGLFMLFNDVFILYFKVFYMLIYL